MSGAADFKNAQRQQESLLAPLERPALQWLVRRIPPWMNSDHLTVMAIGAMFVAGLCCWAAKKDRLWLLGVPVALAVNWFGDSLDGTLARFRNRLRPRYGFYVDHICDCLSTVFIASGMALSGLMTPFIAMGVIIAFLMLSVEAYLTSYAMGKFNISVGYFSPTELRIVLAVGMLALIRWPHALIFGKKYLSLDVGGVCAIVGMAVVFIWLAARHAKQLYDVERIP
jgi:archaetidylinositol phosphate synthase